MTASELIEKLKDVPPDAECVYAGDDGLVGMNKVKVAYDKRLVYISQS